MAHLQCRDCFYFEEKSQEVAVFLRRRGYPQRIISQARDRVMATHNQVESLWCWHTTLPTCRSRTSSQKNLHSVLDDPETAAIFQLLCILCVYRRDNNLYNSLVRSALDNTTATNDDRGTFSSGRTRCNSCAHTDSSASIATPGGHITVLSKCQRKRCVCD